MDSQKSNIQTKHGLDSLPFLWTLKTQNEAFFMDSENSGRLFFMGSEKYPKPNLSCARTHEDFLRLAIYETLRGGLQN